MSSQDPHISSLIHRLLRLLSFLPSFSSPTSAISSLAALTWLSAALPALRPAVWSAVARLWLQQVVTGKGLFRGEEGREEGPRARLSPGLVGGTGEEEAHSDRHRVHPGAGPGPHAMAHDSHSHSHGHGHAHGHGFADSEGQPVVEALQAHEALVGQLEEMLEVGTGRLGGMQEQYADRV